MFKYDSESYSGLSRNGQPTGYKSDKGYWLVKLKGVRHYAHRYIWALFNGPILKGLQIDHINGDKGDNRIENLRMVTQQVNQRNRTKNKNNKSGTTGVLYRERRGHGYWVAVWRENSGKKRERHFSVNIHGDSARHKAEAYRELKLGEDGSMYTDRHGRQE